MKIFVISLPEASSRRTHITAMMEGRSLQDFEFFESVDGRGFDVANHPAHNTLKRRLYFGRDLKGGEMGCLLSHAGIYQKMVDENIPIALILEDDVELYEEFTPVLKALESGPQDFEMIRFLGSKKVSKLQQYTKRTVWGDYTLNRLRTTPGGAHAYVITLEGARKMLRHTGRNYIPIDTLMGHVWKTGVNAFIIQPGLTRQDPAQEQYIGEARFDKSDVQLNTLMKFVFPFTRSWFKFHEGLMKHLSYAKNRLKDGVKR